jgi:hypothetical protein
MFRKCFAAAIALTLVVGGLFAEEIKCKFVSYDEGSGKLVVSVKDKDDKATEQTYTVDKDQKFTRKGKGGKDMEVEAATMMKRFTADTDITLTVDDTDKTKVKNISGGMRKKKTN